MSADLPNLSEQLFEQRLAPFVGRLEDGTRQDLYRRLFAFYQELRRWAPRLALVGAGTAEEVVSRHFGESLAAVFPTAGSPSGEVHQAETHPSERLLPGEGTLVDLGSGAGFPGLVLAAAAPRLRCTLVESRLRKTVFLRAAARKMGVRAEVLQERVGVPLSIQLPDTIDCLTARAVRFPPPVWDALCERLAPTGRVLLWAGSGRPLESQLELVRKISLPNSHSRCILDYRKP